MTMHPKKDDSLHLLPPSEIARQLGLSRTTIQSWMADGVLPSVQMPGSRRRRVFRADVDALIERLRNESADRSQTVPRMP